MGDGRVGGHDKIERLHDGRRVHERPWPHVEIVAKRLDFHALGQIRKLLGSEVLLQANQPHAGNSGQRRKGRQRDRPTPIGCRAGLPLPA